MSEQVPPSQETTLASSAILVVEDDPHFAELVARILSQRFGFHTVVGAKSLAGAIACLETQSFGLIFLDLNLPDSKGITTLSQILPRAEEAQILVMTGEADEEKALLAMRQGAHDYLVKGHLSPDALRRVARYALERYTAGRELRQFRALLTGSMDALPACIAILDPEGRVVITNSRWRNYPDPGNPLIHDCPEGTNYLNIVEKNWNETAQLNGKINQIVKDFLQVLSGQLDRFRVDYSATLDSGPAWYELSVERFNEHGDTHLVVSHLDITTRKELEVNLKTSEDLFTLITQNVVDLMAIIDGSGHRLYTSPSYLRQLGYGSSEMQAFTSSDLLHPDDKSAVTEALGRLFQEGQMEGLLYRLRRKDGQYRNFESNGVVIPDEAAALPRALIVARDITERRSAEVERQEMEVQLRHAQKLEAIGQLAAGIAHEINTPIQYVGDNAIFLQDAFKDVLDFLEVLRVKTDQGELAGEWKDRIEALDLDYLKDEIPRAIQQSLEGVGRVSKIVSAMKDFSHPGGAVRERIDLNRAIESTITISHNVWKYAATLETDLATQLPLIPCFPGEFNQVILNILVNAAHAIEEANAARGTNDLGRIRVSTRMANDCVEILISDTGAGIPEAIRSRIFDPFFTTKAVGKGTGQGLAIARAVIVDKHRGKIEVISTPGQGSTFILQLPLNPPV
ncbi:MAG: PAS domain S-box protein [Holophaga sp.]|nr:PAS domain S-box protein [Holophaga sp.]